MGVCAVILDLILLAVLLLVVFFAWRRGFFVTVLRLGAWIVSIAVAGVLSNALAAPLYETLLSGWARGLIERNLDGALSNLGAAQYAQNVIADLPDAVSRLAARLGGLTPESLAAGLDANKFTAANAAQMLEQSIVAPVGIALCRFAVALLLFFVLMLITRLITRRLEKIRKLPILKQADRILGAALGLVKGALLLFVLVLALLAAAALAEGTAFAELVDSSRIAAFVASNI